MANKVWKEVPAVTTRESLRAQIENMVENMKQAWSEDKEEQMQNCLSDLLQYAATYGYHEQKHYAYAIRDDVLNFIAKTKIQAEDDWHDIINRLKYMLRLQMLLGAISSLDP